MLLATPWLASVAMLAATNLGYRGMWWDEAAQFWVSQGLSSYSSPFSPPRGLRDVARMNCSENLDPGGFSALLRVWTAGGRGLVWLRALPFSFFVAASLALGLLGWRLTRSPVFALAACAAPSFYPAFLYFAFEIRAYSMEMSGVALGALALDFFHERPSTARAILPGVVCAGFLTSRYSFIFAAVALAAALWRASRREAGRRTALRTGVAFLLPASLIALPVWWVTLSYQLHPAMKGGPLGVSSPAYTRGAVLLHGANDLQLILRNLLSPQALPITLAILAAVSVRRRVYARLANGSRRPELERIRERHAAFVPYIIGVQLTSVVASALGLYPWDVASRWSAYLVALSAVAAVVLAAEARSLVLVALADRNGAAAADRRLRIVEVTLAVALVLSASARLMLHRQSVESTRRTNVALQIDRLPLASLGKHTVFVAFYEVPMVRYLYEYGPYRGRPEYPGVFRFETPAEWSAKIPFSFRTEGTAFIVSALSPAEAQARFPDADVRPFGPDGGRLLVVSGRTGAS